MALEEFGRTLRELILHSKYQTGVALARELDIRKQTVSEWVNGQKMPEAKNIARLAQALDVDEGVFWRALGGRNKLDEAAEVAAARGNSTLQRLLAQARAARLDLSINPDFDVTQITDKQIKTLESMVRELLRSQLELTGD